MKFLDVEKRKCGDCDNFKAASWDNSIGYCKERNMTVLRGTLATFKVENGSCFKPILKPLSKKSNFKAKVSFTVGLRLSACINHIEESWLIDTSEPCDVVDMDLEAEGAGGLLEYIGIDLKNVGSWVVEVEGVASEDESPDYTIITLTKHCPEDYGFRS